jgi:two-component system cell cycle response regulator DivK
MPSYRVLLVEDNLDNQFIYRAGLQHAGFEVLIATDGWRGLELAQTADPSVILMDLSIPGIDGLEVTRRLKADAATAGIPIIALTAHALAADKIRAQEAGCDSYLAKPAEPRRVIEAVRRFLPAEQ